MENNLKKIVKKPLSEVDVEPGKQPHLNLGTFKRSQPPKGFAIHLTPDPEKDAISTHVASVDMDDGMYELVLHIANYGTKTIHAEIWKM